MFAKFLDKLAKMPDGDGTMLEHSLFLYGSNMSNSNAHNHYPLPISMVGGWKTVKGGQHLVLPGAHAAGQCAADHAGPRGQFRRTSSATAPENCSMSEQR